MSPGFVVFLVLGAAFLVLVIVAVKKMFRREVAAESARKLASPEEREAEEALAAEAEAAASSSASPSPELPPASESASRVGAPDVVEVATRPEAEAYRRGLWKTRVTFLGRINDLLRGRSLDPKLVDELEEILVTSDIGVRTAQRLLASLRDGLNRREIHDPEIVRAKLREQVLAVLNRDFGAPNATASPHVVMVIGVNGVGKTTTIGKLAHRWHAQGKKVLIAAGDTFRAAAVEQLAIWADRSGCELVRGAEGSDPASVAFDAVTSAKKQGVDVCIVDTAGRLHTKQNLMEELKKVRRVIDKAMPGAPHEVLLILDATTGQNAIAQAQQFKEAVQVSSLALTKLDGTAKGGVVVSISDALSLPVRYVGVGERIEDLRDFDAQAFTDALLGVDQEAGAAA